MSEDSPYPTGILKEIPRYHINHSTPNNIPQYIHAGKAYPIRLLDENFDTCPFQDHAYSYIFKEKNKRYFYNVTDIKIKKTACPVFIDVHGLIGDPHVFFQKHLSEYPITIYKPWKSSNE